MSVISKRFADELDDREMRSSYVHAQTCTRLANQIRTLRVQREWTQEQLGQEMGGRPQGNVARLEDRAQLNPRLSTLAELAAAFDVGLIIKFVPYRDFLIDTRDLTPENLQVESFQRSALDLLTIEPQRVDKWKWEVNKDQASAVLDKESADSDIQKDWMVGVGI